MKNIAAFIEISSDKISSRSLQLIHFIQSVQQSHQKVSLFTFSPVSAIEIPILSNVSLYSLSNLGDSGILAGEQISDLVTKITAEECDLVLANKSSLSDAILTRLSVENDLPLIPQIVSIDLATEEFIVNQSIFSGKAISKLHVSTSCILQMNAAFEFPEKNSDIIKLGANTIEISASNKHEIQSITKLAQGANLGDANYVVGAGRGLKGPENWGMIESLAVKLGAATACSKPVSDVNWRPHSEHVGQTGIKIAPKLYIACGISGAIQHLAGVNGSKTIVVINNDPEAPFFKYADYGIVGDVFDIIPEILKNL